ncbi:MAG: phage tail domain-containing protein [Eubacteriales bacterium]
MLKIRYKNALGETMDIGSSFPFLLGRNRGFAANDVTTLLGKGYNQNGSYYYGSQDEARIVSMTVYFSYLTEAEGKEKRKHIAKVFNPRLGMGQLTYEDDTGKYMIDAVVSVKPEIYKLDENENTMTRSFDVVLTCPKPDWKNFESTQIKMVDFVGGLTFPITFPIKFAERGDGGRIEYTGDNPAPCLLDFRVAQGGTSLSDPVVENHLGEYIKIKKTITQGQRIIVDTNPDAPSIVFVDTDGTTQDAWNSLVFGSKFFQMQRGENVFSFWAASGDPELYLTYRERFAGV